MFLIQKPSEADVQAFLARARESGLTYTSIGATEGNAPDGYVIDHNRIDLGRDWEAAKQAVCQWRMFDFDWVEVFPNTPPIETGETVGVLIRHLGFYSLNAARIVYTIDEPDRFGFAYGTLEDHAESGEERFLVERDADGVVQYDLKAFSRPNRTLAVLGYPLVRTLQKQFGQESKRAMFRAVNSIG